jgi:hypothetical protein
MPFACLFRLFLHLRATLIKKKIRLSSYIRKFRMEQLQSHIWLTASSYIWWNICAFPHILESLPHIWLCNCSILNFPSLWVKFYFIFYQCIVRASTGIYVSIVLKHTSTYTTVEPGRSSSQLCRNECKDMLNAMQRGWGRGGCTLCTFPWPLCECSSLMRTGRTDGGCAYQQGGQQPCPLISTGCSRRLGNAHIR